jgi:hypothetical protein
MWMVMVCDAARGTEKLCLYESVEVVHLYAAEFQRA